MQDQPNFSMKEIMKIASSPAGQQLIQKLHAQGGDSLQQAISKAMAGDYDQAKEALSHLLQDPETQRLLDGLGR